MNRSREIDYQRISRHLLFWVAYITFQAINDGWENKDVLSFNLPPQFLTDVPVAILVTYVNLYVLLPKYYAQRKYLGYVVGLIGLLLVGSLLERFFTYCLWVPMDRVREPLVYLTENRSFWIPVRILRNTVEIFPVVAAAMLLKLMNTSYIHEKQLRTLEKEKFTAEMGLLKAQLNPHFFFNTLNSLYALILTESKKAGDLVLKLAELMTYTLYEANAEKVQLKTELTNLKAYIEIERLRFGDRIDLSCQFSGEPGLKQIAPMLLLPFVENAFKHGLEDNTGWVTILVNITEDGLTLHIENSFLADPKAKTGGIGLENVRKRLDLVYPGNYGLRILQNNNIYEVELKLAL